MISIFYNTRAYDSSYDEHIRQMSHYKDNEIQHFVNDGSVSLAASYNKFLLSAKYARIIFIHDDIELTKDFDKIIYENFENSDYGIIGVAGTANLDASGVWWANKNAMSGKVWHENDNKRYYTIYAPERSGLYDSVCIDGVFMAIDTERIKHGFDERFDGFHYYDIPFCVLNYNDGVRIGVSSKIAPLHKSIGEVDDKWQEARQLFLKEYSELLPLKCSPNIEIENIEYSKKINTKVSIIIPSKNNYELLSTCVNSIKHFTKGVDYEILIADTGSFTEIKDKIRNELLGEKTFLREYDYYHFGKINNDMAKKAKGTYLLMCNDDIELLNDGISKMAELALANKDCGAIGARLHYEDGTVQHGGIALYGSMSQKKLFISHIGLKSHYNVSVKREKDIFGCTAAFLMLKKSLFLKIGGFIENNESCFEDVILNVELIKRKLKNIFSGQSVCLHRESSSRSKSADKHIKEANDLKNILMPYLYKNYNYIKKHVIPIK